MEVKFNPINGIFPLYFMVNIDDKNFCNTYKKLQDKEKIYIYNLYKEKCSDADCADYRGN